MRRQQPRESEWEQNRELERIAKAVWRYRAASSLAEPSQSKSEMHPDQDQNPRECVRESECAARDGR